MLMDGVSSREMMHIMVCTGHLYHLHILTPVQDKAAEILAALCIRISISAGRLLVDSRESSTWLLKANVTVLRHADRTPKQKLKFNFPIGETWTQPFVRLLNNETEEIILREREQLTRIAKAIEEAKRLGAVGEDLAKLTQLNSALFNKIEFPGTKAQLKPVYSRKQADQDRKLTKLTLVFKWGGEVCRYPAIEKFILTAHAVNSSLTQPDINLGILGKTSKRTFPS
jgi:Histidine phosphatase superfamily (branch 2)